MNKNIKYNNFSTQIIKGVFFIKFRIFRNDPKPKLFQKKAPSFLEAKYKLGIELTQPKHF